MSLRNDLDALTADAAPLRDAVDKLKELDRRAGPLMAMWHDPSDARLHDAIVAQLTARTKPLYARSLELWRRCRQALCDRRVRLGKSPTPSTLDAVLPEIVIMLDAIELHDAFLQPAADAAET